MATATLLSRSKTIIPKGIGRNIFNLRIKKNMSYEELSKASRVDEWLIEALESGEFKLGVDALHRIAEALGSTLEEIQADN